MRGELAPVDLAGGLIYWGLIVFVLIRFGLLAIVVQGFFHVLLFFPLTTQMSSWYAGILLAGILLMPRWRSMLSTPRWVADRLSEVAPC